MSYACHNREPFAAMNTLPARWVGDTPLHIPFTMTPDCQYTHTALGQADPGCTGCKHKTSETSE